jgi:DNA-binding HxlR family transcriptional regulator
MAILSFRRLRYGFYTTNTSLSIERLFHHRWSVPILAELERAGGGSRFAPIVNRLGLSRQSLRQTLDALIDAGLVMRNPGYGHPLRPEYVLTERGRRLAPNCTRLVAALEHEGLVDVGLKKWSVPVLVALAEERRFGELRDELQASPRALTLALKELADAGLVERRVHDDFPPSTSYRLTPRARRLRRLAAAL